MAKYEIKGQLYFFEEFQFGLKSNLSYRAGDDLEVLIKNSPENILEVVLMVISEDKESAIIRAGNELERISNLISWFYNVPVIKWKINGVTFSKKKGSQNTVVMAETITLSAGCYIKKVLGKESLKKLKKQLTKNYRSDFEEILIMWREALAEKSNGLKFFLFYRILEKLCKGASGDSNSMKVDKFIEGKIGNVEKRDNGRGNQVTIFTFLRDNIHAKSSKFPYKEIERYLPQLQDLVKRKIEEVFCLKYFYLNKESVIVKKQKKK